MADLKLGVIGAGGRMGQAVIQQIKHIDGVVLEAACDRPGSEVIGQDAGEVAGVGRSGIEIGDSPENVFDTVESVIEFSSPESSVKNALMAADRGRVHVIGTTGLSVSEEKILAEAGERARLVYAPNMSVAVNILFAITRQVASILDEDFDIEILEMHHRNKVDAPSGTALGLGRAAAEGRKVDFSTKAVLSREGQTGQRNSGDIGFATLRGGDVTGDHTVVFAAEGERLELSHRASSRAIFSRGAVRAARWAQDQVPGVYTMADVLGLTELA
jgi:4-hydroxy-tetrahydrodipicolinate reductase